jgi:CBS domain containing-hemolysin-like protein
VLADLIAYCHGRKTTFDVDARVHAFKEGQRDVLMRIVELTNLTIEEIYHLRTSAIALKEETDEY